MLTNSLPSHQHSIKYCHHFIKEERWAEGLNDLPKTTELVSESELEPRPGPSAPSLVLLRRQWKEKETSYL